MALLFGLSGCGDDSAVFDAASDVGTTDGPATDVPDEDSGVDETDAAFDPTVILDVDIELPAESWDTLRAQTRGLIETLSGDCLAGPFPSPFTWFEGSVTINGERFERVDVRKKGFIGSLSTERPGIKLDIGEYVDGQRYSGVRRMTLNNSISDPAVVRQCLGYSLFAQAGIPAPRCNFARVNVNGEDLGLYVNVEAVRGPYLRRHFESSDGNLYEGTLSDFRPEMAGTFEPKNNEEIVERTDITAVVDALQIEDDAEMLERLATLVDIDRFLTFWAMETLVDHTDGYNANRNNFFVYADPATGLFDFLPWGVDGIFRAQLVARDLPQSVYPRSILAYRLYGIPEVRAQYFERLDTLLSTVWNEAAIDTEILRMRDLLAPTVEGEARTRLVSSIDQLRGAIADRRGLIDAERAVGEPDVGELVDPLQCLNPIGTATGTFATTWGTIESEMFFAGDSTFEVVVDGEPLVFNMTGSAAGVGDDGPAIFVLGSPRFGVIYILSFGLPAALITPGMFGIDLLGGVRGFFGVLEGGAFRLIGIAGGELVLDEAAPIPDAPVSGTFDMQIYQGL